MPDFDRMMYQTPFWRSHTMGRDIYAPQREHMTGGQVDRHVLPAWGEQGWPQVGYQPATPDPYLRQQGFQQTGIFGGPAGRAETYRGPQTPMIATPVGWDKGFDAYPAAGPLPSYPGGRPLPHERPAAKPLGSIPTPVVQGAVVLAALAAAWKLGSLIFGGQKR